MTLIAVVPELDSEEKQRFAEHETIIEQGLNTFYEVGTALLDIRDSRLYRREYGTFEDYCQTRWEMSRRRANQLIESASVVGHLGTTVPKPDNERQTRALSQFSRELHPVILQTAKARYSNLTESNITRVGNVIREMTTTGHVDIGNGSSTPIDAALSIEDEEAVKRQKAYIAEALERREVDPDTGEIQDGGRHKPKLNRAGDETTSMGFDRCQTPPEALDPLLPYLPREWTIWEPACGDGLLVEALYESGFDEQAVVGSDVLTGQNFFDFEPGVWDALVTNPPYSIKYKWLARCYALGKPFALLLPVETLGAKQAQELFREYGLEVILLDRRINFRMPNKGWEGSAQFPVAWFTWHLDIGQQLTFGRLRR